MWNIHRDQVFVISKRMKLQPPRAGRLAILTAGCVPCTVTCADAFNTQARAEALEEVTSGHLAIRWWNWDQTRVSCRVEEARLPELSGQHPSRGLLRGCVFSGPG